MIRTRSVLLVATSLSTIPNLALSQVVINEGFEDTEFDRSPEGYITNGYCNEGGYICSNASGYCNGCGPDASPNVVSIQSEVIHSGTSAFKGEFLGHTRGGECGAAGFKILTPDYPQIPNKFHIRLYIRFDPGLRFNNSGNKILARSSNLYLTIEALDQKEYPWGSMANSPYGAIGVYSSSQSSKTICEGVSHDLATMNQKRQCDAGDGSDWIIDTTNPAHTNGWWYVEVMFDTDNDLFSLWAKRPNDTSVTQMYSNMAWNFDPGVGDGLDFLWWNACPSDGSNGGGIIYIDDISIGTTYIGPMNDDIVTDTIPDRPKHVRIIR